MTAEIVQHPNNPDPNNPDPPPPKTEEPNDSPEDEDEDEDEDEEPEPGELEFATRELIIMIKHEIGVRWMSCPLRLQLEHVELLLRDNGTPDAI